MRKKKDDEATATQNTLAEFELALEKKGKEQYLLGEFWVSVFNYNHFPQNQKAAPSAFC